MLLLLDNVQQTALPGALISTAISVALRFLPSDENFQKVSRNIDNTIKNIDNTVKISRNIDITEKISN
jgi:hypothetical protein